MRLGICAQSEKFEYIQKLGFDYIEHTLTSISRMSDTEVEALRVELDRCQLSIDAVNSFCKSDMKLSFGVDLDAVRAYSESALAKAARLGTKILVIGSGGARRIPDGCSVEDAEKNFKAVLNTVADVAAAHGIRIAVEPLNRKECNFINTLANAAKMCEELGRDNVGCVLDLYHFYMSGEDMSDIEKYGKHIIHVHIARMNEDRGTPTLADADWVTNAVFALDRVGYSGRMSLESSYYPDFETAVKNYAYMLEAIGVKKTSTGE